MSIISDLIPQVAAYLQNRSDVAEGQTNTQMNPSSWIQSALMEITANYPFEELRTVGPLATIGPGLGVGGSNYMYAITTFLNINSGTGLPDDYTLMEDPVIFLTTAQALSVGLVGTVSGVSAYGMDYLSPKAIQPIIFIGGGIPFKYTRYGPNFWFGTQPGSNFNVYLPYQIRHPFNSSNLPNSPVFVPPDWIDIICYAAAERGAVNLRWNDQATFIHQILYGDPDYQRTGGKQGRPGLIAAKLFQPERDKRLSPVMVMPFAQRY